MSLELVKELRTKTGAGMLDCQNALKESGGNMEKAVDFLRKKGLAAAAKKASRSAKEGMLGFYSDSKGNEQALVEVNCETDFVVKTEDFQNFVKKLTNQIVAQKPNDLNAAFEIKMDGRSVRDTLTDLVGKIGENIQFRRFVNWKTNGSAEKITSYLHAGNKIGVLVRFENATALKVESGRDVAMHIAAMSPQFVSKEQVGSDTIEKEKEIYRAQMKDEKKPAAIMEKILEGKIKKHLADVCLEDQNFVKDPEGKKSVKEWLTAQAPGAKIKEFVRLEVGEGN